MAEKEITQDGETYILKSTVEGIISKRLSTYASKLQSREAEFDALQSKFDEASSKLGQIDTFQQRITQLEGDLAHANTRYDRHSVLSGIGVNDESVRATFEHLHSTLGGETPFSDWVNGMKEDPSKAPLILQSFIKPQGDQTGQQQQQNNQAHNAQNPPPNPNQPPKQTQTAPPSNNGVIQTSIGAMGREEILNRAKDPAFYSQNRDAIKQAWSNRA
jgi:hypothetical protein